MVGLLRRRRTAAVGGRRGAVRGARRGARRAGAVLGGGLRRRGAFGALHGADAASVTTSDRMRTLCGRRERRRAPAGGGQRATGGARRTAARSCTSTWMRSSPRSSWPAGRSSVVCRSSSAAGAVASFSRRATRPGRSACTPPCPWRRRSSSVLRRSSIPPDPCTRYHEVSTGVMQLLSDVTALVEQVSMDEAFLDVIGARRRLGPPTVIAALIRRRVHEQHGITCSVGIGSTKLVAELASGQAKPDGVLLVLAAGDGRLPAVRCPSGPCGRCTASALKTPLCALRGSATVAELGRTVTSRTVQQAVGRITPGAHLFDLSWGRDPRPVFPRRTEKSVSAEENFAADVADLAVVQAKVHDLADRCAARLRTERAGGEERLGGGADVGSAHVDALPDPADADRRRPRGLPRGSRAHRGGGPRRTARPAGRSVRADGLSRGRGDHPTTSTCWRRRRVNLHAVGREVDRGAGPGSRGRFGWICGPVRRGPRRLGGYPHARLPPSFPRIYPEGNTGAYG